VQQAIENIKEGEDNLTIIMIAHRLQTIETAQNLLYINSPKQMLAAEKYTEEYDYIMNLLKTETYKHQESADHKNESSEEEDIPSERTDRSLADSRFHNSEQRRTSADKKDRAQKIDLEDLVPIAADPVLKKAASRKDSTKLPDETLDTAVDDEILKDAKNDKVDVGFRRIMKYYNPKWAAVLSFISSMIGSLSFPLFGWCFSEFLFIIMAP